MANRIQEFSPGTIIFREGALGKEMYILQEGAIDLKKRVGDGEKLLKTIDVPNDFFGEMALVDNSPRSATAITRDTSRLLVVDAPSFENLVMTNGKFALKVIKKLSERIRNSNLQISELISEVPKDRFIRAMLEYTKISGEKIFNGGMKIETDKMKEWVNKTEGIPTQDIENHLYRMLKVKDIEPAAGSTKKNEEIILPISLLRNHGFES